MLGLKEQRLAGPSHFSFSQLPRRGTQNPGSIHPSHQQVNFKCCRYEEKAAKKCRGTNVEKGRKKKGLPQSSLYSFAFLRPLKKCKKLVRKRATPVVYPVFSHATSLLETLLRAKPPAVAPQLSLYTNFKKKKENERKATDGGAGDCLVEPLILYSDHQPQRLKIFNGPGSASPLSAGCCITKCRVLAGGHAESGGCDGEPKFHWLFIKTVEAVTTAKQNKKKSRCDHVIRHLSQQTTFEFVPLAQDCYRQNYYF